MRSLLFALAATMLFTLPAQAAQTPLPVVVSIAPQKWIVEQIAGPENVAVTVLVRPGADAHAYEPTPSQMKETAGAKLYFTIGMPFETVWAPRIADASKDLSTRSMIKGLKRLSFEGGAPEPVEAVEHDAHRHERDHSHDHAEESHGHHHDADPHTWLAPGMVRYMIPIVTRELSRQMPDKGELFKTNAAALEQRLQDADQTMEEIFSKVPKEKRVFLTFHPAWQYFAHTYGMRELTIEVEGKEPGPQGMKAVIDMARKYGLTTVFAEPQYSRSAVQAIAENIGAKVVVVDPLAENLLDTWALMTKHLMESWGE